MIKFENVTKKCGGEIAVKDISEVIGEESVAILGETGSGKSTIARLICGITAPTKGSVSVDGEAATSSMAAETVGYMPTVCPLAPQLTLAESLGYMAKLRGLGEDDIDQALTEADINNDNADRIVAVLSDIDKKRAALAYALLGSPKYLVLDQPIFGLGEEDEKEILELLSDLKEKYILIYTSDTVEDARGLCSTVALLSSGRVVASGDFNSVLFPNEKNITYKVRARGDKELIKSILDESETVVNYKASMTSSGTAVIELTATGGEGTETQIKKIFADAGVKVSEVRKAESLSDKVLSALLERQDEKEEKRRIEREMKAPPVKLTTEMIAQTLLEDDDEADEYENDDNDGSSDDMPKIQRHDDGAENAYRVKLTEDFIAQALRESDDGDGAEDEDDGEAERS